VRFLSKSQKAADLALSMPAKSRQGRFKIAFSASFGVVRRAILGGNVENYKYSTWISDRYRSSRERRVLGQL